MTEMLHNLEISNFHPFKYKMINSINMHVNINQNAGESHFYTDKVVYSKPCLKRSFKKKTNIWFPDRLLLNAGQKYCRILLQYFRFHKAFFAITIFVLSIFEWPFKTGFTVHLVLNSTLGMVYYSYQITLCLRP